VKIETLEDGTELLVSNEKIQTMYLTKEGEDQVCKYAIVLTPELRKTIVEDWIRGLNIT